jgi:hypothetical protein
VVRRRLLIILFALLAVGAVGVNRATAAEPGDELTISIITIEPGDEIFEKFAHNAIRVRDASAGTDLLYNYGVFDFDQSRFFYRFLKGDLDYWVDEEKTEDALAWYQGHDRSIWEQDLNLSPQQKIKLRDFLIWNIRDENKFYHYNYYTDNCSTRVRDAIDHVLDGQLKSQLDAKPTGTTWRWHTRRLTRGNVLWYSALNTVMGPNIDRPISAWEESFLPVKMREHLRGVVVNGGQPLVSAEYTLYTSSRTPEPTQPPKWWIIGYLLVGSLTGGTIVWLARRPKRRAYLIVATIVAALLGVAGWFGLWAWLCTQHWSVYRNENLFGFSPIAMLLAFALPRALRKKTPRAVLVARWSAIFIGLSCVLAIILKPVLPTQVNGEALALVLPINLALAWTVWHLTHEKRTDLPSDPQRAS